MSLTTETINTLSKKYLEIKEQIKALEAIEADLKKDLLAVGTTETNEYKIEVKEVVQNRVVSANELLEALGPVVVTEHGLIKESKYDKLVVKGK